MKALLRFVFFLIVWMSAVIGYPTAGQSNATRETEADKHLVDTLSDESIEAVIEKAWAEVNRYWERKREDTSDELGDPQPEFAEKLYQIYLSHRDSAAGHKALKGAFAMWGNIGAADQVEQALTEINPDSKIWASILSGIRNAYFGADRSDDLAQLYSSLRTKLTHPLSRSGLLLTLARDAMETGEDEKARSYYEELIQLDANPFYVRNAKGGLHELAALGVGQPAPRFKARDLEGNLIKLSALRGKIVVLEFWATWCGPCYGEIPHLRRMHAEHEDNAFALVGVALDEDIENLQRTLGAEGINWPQILQENKHDGRISKLYNIFGIPTAYLIDSHGRIAAKKLRAEELEERVRELLAELGNQE